MAKAEPLEDVVMRQDDGSVMQLLQRGIPLTLLMDLLSPLGTASDVTLAAERPDVA